MKCYVSKCNILTTTSSGLHLHRFYHIGVNF